MQYGHLNNAVLKVLITMIEKLHNYLFVCQLALFIDCFTAENLIVILSTQWCIEFVAVHLCHSQYDICNAYFATLKPKDLDLT